MRGRNLIKCALLVSVISLLFVEAAQAQSFTSGLRRANFVELYTSEGCSSCPIAEEWVSGLTDKEGLWTEFIPVAFHVNYWDYIGWKDRFASTRYTNRQKKYVVLWNSGAWAFQERIALYTPCMTMNGVPWRNWFQYKTVPSAKNNEVGVLNVETQDQNVFDVSFVPERKSKAAWKINAALLGFGIVSKVNAGENRGRTLKHDFVVLKLKQKGLNANGDALETNLSLEKPEEKGVARYGVAFWISKGDNPVPIQATGGYLN